MSSVANGKMFVKMWEGYIKRHQINWIRERETES